MMQESENDKSTIKSFSQSVSQSFSLPVSQWCAWSWDSWDPCEPWDPAERWKKKSPNIIPAPESKHMNLNNSFRKALIGPNSFLSISKLEYNITPQLIASIAPTSDKSKTEGKAATLEKYKIQIHEGQLLRN